MIKSLVISENAGFFVIVDLLPATRTQGDVQIRFSTREENSDLV
jgi:hypothetical protein